MPRTKSAQRSERGSPMGSKRIVVGISGSSGAVYGARLCEVLAGLDVEVHLIVTGGARATLAYEAGLDVDEVARHADVVYADADVGAAVASGTFLTMGMVVAPCSVKTLSAIANSYADTLISRAADVVLKERRRLVVVVRETPLHIGHLRLMSKVTEAGGVILPPVPGFYVRPKTVEDIVDHTITKILDQFDIDAGLIERWTGLGE